MNILIITDNDHIYKKFNEIVACDRYSIHSFYYNYSHNNKVLMDKYKASSSFKPITIKSSLSELLEKYELIISLHCKQLFPSELVNNVRCINVHPGLNPYNRGWFPQVFSIINKLPSGVTIHEMDDQLDHGPIIIQQEITIDDWETSSDVYNRIQELEIQLIDKNLMKIIDNEYNPVFPDSVGNINLKKDFDELCEIDLDKKVTYREAIDFLRSMSFKGYKNAYFYDEEGNKIFVEVELEKENRSDE